MTYPGAYPGSTTFPGSGTYVPPPPPPPGGPQLIATPEPLASPPRVRLEIVGFVTGLTSATVSRLDNVAGFTPVRAGDPVAVSAGAAVLYDYEAPWNVALTYQVSPTGLLSAVTATPVTLSVAGGWFVHPGLPSLSVPANVLLPIGDDQRDANIGLHWVLGRETPIQVTDGVRKAAQFSLTAWTTTYQSGRGLDSVIADLSPLLLQVADPAATGGGDPEASLYRWVSIGQVNTSRGGQPLGDPWREWSMACTTVSRPVGQQLSGARSWSALVAECGSWAEVLTRYRTWRGVVLGLQGT